MLEDYKQGQPIAYKIFINAIKNKHVHAYLFQVNDCMDAKDIAVSFAKSLICDKHFFENSNKECGDCTICHRIEKNCYPELVIVDSEGLWIKKEQLIDLQKKFSKKSIEGNNKVYIINGVEKLNASAANSILKFLEEPEENIVAILLAYDIQSVLKTILSRCQIIALKPNNQINIGKGCAGDQNMTLLKIGTKVYNDRYEMEKYLSDKQSIVKTEAIINFIKNYEINGETIIVNVKNLWFDYFGEKNEMLLAFTIMILFYKDVLNVMNKKKLEVFDYYLDDIDEVARANNNEKIIKKLQKIIFAKDKIKYNVNANLLMDKLIIEMEGGVKI